MTSLDELVRECAKSGVRIREVPFGNRVSVPIASSGDNLVEISIQELDHDFVRLTDAGFLRERLLLEGLTNDAPRNRLADYMADRGYEIWDDRGGTEYGWEGHVDDAGCAALDLGADIYAALRIAENSLKERQPPFVKLMDGRMREAFGAELEYRHVWHRITFPFSHVASGIKGTYVGTNAVNPSIASVANNQFMPLMRAKAIMGAKAQGRRVAIVQDAFKENDHVRSLARDAGARIIPEGSFHEGLRNLIDSSVGSL